MVSINTYVLHIIKRCLGLATVSYDFICCQKTPKYMKNEGDMERRFTLRLPDDLAKEIDSFVESSGMTMTQFVRRALREKLDRENGTAPDAQVSRAEFDELKKRLAGLEEEADAMRKFLEATRKEDDAAEGA